MPTLRIDVFFLCVNSERDPCAPYVAQAILKTPGLVIETQEIDGYPIMSWQRPDGTLVKIVRTNNVVSNDYRRYAPIMNANFGSVRTAIVVNWHEGANAPDRVLTFHSTGDVPAGVFAPTDPDIFAGYTRALERERRQAGLDGYRTVVEATHWSGVMFGAQPADVMKYNYPIYDLEIGSSSCCWKDERACAVISMVCLNGPDLCYEAPAMLYCGGVHFEETVTNALLSGHWSVGHVLPNHWLVSGAYDEDIGGKKLKSCVDSYTKMPEKIIIHKGLNSKIKNRIITIGKLLDISTINHKRSMMDNILLRKDDETC